MKRHVCSVVMLTSLLALGSAGLVACGEGDPATNNLSNDPTPDGGDDADAGNNGEDDGGDEDGGGTPDGPFVEAADQFLAAADSNRVTVDAVESDGAGWVVVHEDDDGPGEILGATDVPDSETTDVEVELNRDVEDGETLHAMLHEDAEEDDDFDPDVDEAVSDDDGVIMDDFVVSLPSISTSETQTLDDLSTVVSVDQARSKGAGWAVVHEGACLDGDGEPAFGAPIGAGALEDGENEDIEVVLDRPAEDDEDLCAMLHVDDPDDGEYTFDPGDDEPEDPPAILADSEQILMDSFSVQVPDGTPAVRVHIDGGDQQNYTFGDVEPEAHGEGMGGQDDPELVLYAGWRYEFVNAVTDDHPFQFIAPGLVSEDQVVLSQDEEGSAENDADVEWNEEGDTFSFNVAGPFIDDINGVEAYECAIHEAMSGSVIVEE